MLSEEIKSEIQQVYSTFLERKSIKPRYSQRHMIADIARYLGEIRVDASGCRISPPATCVIEAGTGTGKTLAYSIAGILVARALKKKLVISTATVALQEQLVNKDLPDLQQHGGVNFTFGLAKGRGRYLCLAKLDQLLQAHADESAPQFLLASGEQGKFNLPLYQEMLDQIIDGDWNGDRDTWKDALEDADWRRVTTDHRQCTNRRCSYFLRCSFFEARQQIENVDCIIANHDLVLADLALGGGAILPAPQDTIYVFDEAHHLADKAINHFAHSTFLNSSRDWLKQVTKTVASLLTELGTCADIKRDVEQVAPATQQLDQDLSALLAALLELNGWDQDQDRGNQRVLRFPQGIVPDQIRALCHQLLLSTAQLCRLFERMTELLRQTLDDKREEDISKEDAERWYAPLGLIYARFMAMYDLWKTYAVADPEGGVPIARWLRSYDGEGRQEIAVFSSPIMASGILSKQLWERCFGAVLTSATLTSLGTFDRVRVRSGLPEDSHYRILPSPFDYTNACTLTIPRMRNEPESPEFSDETVERLLEYVDPQEGTLVLFSSRSQMQAVRRSLEDSPLDGLIITQDDYTKNEVLRRHRERIDQDLGSIVFGLASFSEGVDLPGRYLTHVVIVRLPFAVPDDPVEATLAEWIQARGGNPFLEVSLPDAATKLVQACGRLLRSETDQGRITVLDRRLVSRWYGKRLLNALPAFRRDIQ